MIAVQRVGAALVAFVVLTAVRGGCFQGRCPSVIHCRPYSDVHVPSPSPVTPGHFRRIARFVYHPNWLLEVLLVISTVTTHRQHAVRTGPLSCTRLLSVLICG